MTLDLVVVRARGAGEAVGWQGATTKWAPAHEEEQRSQRAEAPDQRVRSGYRQNFGFGKWSAVIFRSTDAVLLSTFTY